MKRLSILALSLMTLAIGFQGCDKKAMNTSGGSSSSGGGSGMGLLPGHEVILKYKDGTITAKDVASEVAQPLGKLREEYVKAYTDTAQRVLVDRLLGAEAKKAGLANPEALLNQKANAVSVSDSELVDFKKQNKDRLKNYRDPKTGKQRPITDVELKGFLMERKKGSIRQGFVRGLLASAGVKTVLEPPRVVIKADDSPFKGSKTAKVVIEEFSDFKCGYCSRAKNIVDQIHKAYGDKVKIVFRDFPFLSPESEVAALAAQCAHKQNKFWVYHDKMFDNQRAISAANYDKWAKEVGLDVDKFKKCLTSKATLPDINKDKEVARSIGVNSTPTFFVNGKRVAGALPFEQFKVMIDAELNK